MRDALHPSRGRFRSRMTGHNAEDIVGQVDWDDWPDFELFAGDEAEEAAEPDEDAA